VIVCRFYKSDQTRESTGRNRPATDYLRFTCMKPNMGMQNACSDLKVCDASLRARWFKTFAITRGSSYW